MQLALEVEESIPLFRIIWRKKLQTYKSAGSWSLLKLNGYKSQKKILAQLKNDKELSQVYNHNLQVNIKHISYMCVC